MDNLVNSKILTVLYGWMLSKSVELWTLKKQE